MDGAAVPSAVVLYIGCQRCRHTASAIFDDVTISLTTATTATNQRL